MHSSLHYMWFETTDLIVTAHVLLPCSPSPPAGCLQPLAGLLEAWGNLQPFPLSLSRQFNLLSHYSNHTPPSSVKSNKQNRQDCLSSNKKLMRHGESSWCIWLQTRIPRYRERDSTAPSWGHSPGSKQPALWWEGGLGVSSETHTDTQTQTVSFYTQIILLLCK